MIAALLLLVSLFAPTSPHVTAPAPHVTAAPAAVRWTPGMIPTRHPWVHPPRVPAPAWTHPRTTR